MTPICNVETTVTLYCYSLINGGPTTFFFSKPNEEVNYSSFSFTQLFTQTHTAKTLVCKHKSLGEIEKPEHRRISPAMSSPSPETSPATNASAPSSSPPLTTESSQPSPPPPPPLLPLPPPLPPPPKGGLATGALVGLIVGIGIGGLIVLVGVCIFVIFYRRRNRRNGHDNFHSDGPPQGSKSEVLILFV